jgi:hypothetical protein
MPPQDSEQTVVPTSVWSLTFDLTRLVRPARTSSPYNTTNAVVPSLRQGIEPITLERTEHIRLYQKIWLDHLERLDRILLHKLDLNVDCGNEGMQEDIAKDGRLKAKRTGRKIESSFLFEKNSEEKKIILFFIL